MERDEAKKLIGKWAGMNIIYKLASGQVKDFINYLYMGGFRIINCLLPPYATMGEDYINKKFLCRLLEKVTIERIVVDQPTIKMGTNKDNNGDMWQRIKANESFTIELKCRKSYLCDKPIDITDEQIKKNNELNDKFWGLEKEGC